MILLERVRREFAEELRRTSGLRSAGLVRALATVPRERFVGPGPWRILRPSAVGREYELTPDDDPRHLYQNVLVALDPDRRLNNGEPAALARWIDELDLAPGSSFLHVGCGVGYYTAIAAEVVAPDGRVVAIEIDPALGRRAADNLEGYDGVRVLCGDGSTGTEGIFDAIFVNAGVTQVRAGWLDRMDAGGRLLVPLTVGLNGIDAGVGHMIRIARHPGGYGARFVSPVGIFHCANARDPHGNERLRQAYRDGDVERVRSLRRDRHDPNGSCWLHATSFCLSALEPAG